VVLPPREVLRVAVVPVQRELLFQVVLHVPFAGTEVLPIETGFRLFCHDGAALGFDRRHVYDQHGAIHGTEIFQHISCLTDYRPVIMRYYLLSGCLCLRFLLRRLWHYQHDHWLNRRRWR